MQPSSPCTAALGAACYRVMILGPHFVRVPLLNRAPQLALYKSDSSRQSSSV